MRASPRGRRSSSSRRAGGSGATTVMLEASELISVALRRIGVVGLERCEQRLDVGRVLHGPVGTEQQFRGRAQVQVTTEPAPDEAARALEGPERRGPLLLRSQYRDVDLRVLEIGTGVHLGDRDEAQARVFELTLDEHRDFFLDQLIHPLEPLALHGASQNFYLYVGDVAVHVVLDVVHGLRDHLVGVPGVTRDTGQGERRALPDVVMVHLGDRDLEAAAQRVLESLERVALAFERSHVGQVQLDGADRHPRARHRYKVRATSSVVKASMTSLGCTPLMPSMPIPHSRPWSTSRTSSLNRLSEDTVLSPRTVSPRLMRVFAPRTILPSVTAEP